MPSVTLLLLVVVYAIGVPVAVSRPLFKNHLVPFESLSAAIVWPLALVVLGVWGAYRAYRFEDDERAKGAG